MGRAGWLVYRRESCPMQGDRLCRGATAKPHKSTRPPDPSPACLCFPILPSGKTWLFFLIWSGDGSCETVFGVVAGGSCPGSPCILCPTCAPGAAARGWWQGFAFGRIRIRYPEELQICYLSERANILKRCCAASSPW